MNSRCYLGAIGLVPLCTLVVMSAVVLAADLNSDLRKAAEKGDTEQIQALLAEGADVNAVDGCGRSVLFKAAEKGHLEAVRMFIEAGANQITNSRDLEEDLRDAAKDGELERLQSLLEAGVNIDESDGDGRTALYKAAKEGRIEAVQLLLEAGAGQIERSRRVWKDLREAAERGEVEKLQALIEAGVNANSFDSRGRRALMLAAEKGRLDAVRLLIDHGSDEVPPRVSLRRLLETDFQNESALDKARRKERTDVIAVLEAEEARLLALEQEREREAERVRSNFERARSNRLSRYEVGVTTRAEFRSEWDFVSSREQGIVLVTGDGRTIIYSLGRSTLAGLFGSGGSKRLEQAALKGQRATDSVDFSEILCELTFSISGAQNLVRTTCG